MCLVLVQISEPGPNGKWVWKIKPQNQLFKVVFNSLLLFPSCSMGNFFTYQKFQSRKWKIKSTWRTHVNQRQEIMNIKSLEPQRFFKNLQFLPIDKTTFFFKFWLACNHPTLSFSFILLIFLHHAFYFYCFGKENETTVSKVKKLKKTTRLSKRNCAIFPYFQTTQKRQRIAIWLFY